MIKELVTEIIMLLVMLFLGAGNMILFFAADRMWPALGFLFVSVLCFMVSWNAWKHIKDMVNTLDENLELNNRHIVFLNDAVLVLSGAMSIEEFQAKYEDKDKDKDKDDGKDKSNNKSQRDITNIIKQYDFKPYKK